MSKQSKNHSLFCNKVSANHWRLFLDALEEYNEVEIHEIYNSLLESLPQDVLEIRINSHGGFIKTGQVLHNIINDMFPDRCITVIDSMALSMAAVIFVQGKERIIYPHSTLLFHDYSSQYTGKAVDIKEQIEFDAEVYNVFFEKNIKPFLVKKEWKQFKRGNDLWFNATEMCERQIATHIIHEGKKLTAEEYIEGK